MKKIILSAALLLSSLLGNSQVIDFDYNKYVKSNLVFIDYNNNMDVDDGEAYEGNATAQIEYKDFGSAGSIMKIACKFYKGSKSLEIVASLEDVTLTKSKHGYIVRNKIGETLFGILPRESGSDIIAIFDIAYFKIRR